MFVTNWISTTKIQKISEITNFFRHYFLSRTEVYHNLGGKNDVRIDVKSLAVWLKWDNFAVRKFNQINI